MKWYKQACLRISQHRFNCSMPLLLSVHSTVAAGGTEKQNILIFCLKKKNIKLRGESRLTSSVVLLNEFQSKVGPRRIDRVRRRRGRLVCWKGEKEKVIEWQAAPQRRRDVFYMKRQLHKKTVWSRNVEFLGLMNVSLYYFSNEWVWYCCTIQHMLFYLIAVLVSVTTSTSWCILIKENP